MTWPVRRWLAAGSAWHQLPWHRRLRLDWLSAWGSLNARLADAVAAQQVPPPAIQAPLLVAGLWRSGTTVMHELLSSGLGLATPLTWQCMNAASIGLTRPPVLGHTIERPMDGLRVGLHTPQEDEFALLTLGAESAYRAFLDPGRLDELLPTLNPDHWQQHREWLPVWEGFLRKVLASQSSLSQPMVLKSPNHTFRLPAILQRFPQTRVVWMARDPAHIFHSNLKMWRVMFTEHALTGSASADLVPFLTQGLDRAAEVLAHCRAVLPAAQFIVVGHDELLASPVEVVRRVARQLLPERTLDELALARTLAQLKSGRIDHHPASLPAKAMAAATRLRMAQADTMARPSPPAAARVATSAPAARQDSRLPATSEHLAT